MPWSEEEARRACEEFAEFLDFLDPEVMEKLQEAWGSCYLRAGHKRLGRLVLGQTVDEACRARGD